MVMCSVNPYHLPEWNNSTTGGEYLSISNSTSPSSNGFRFYVSAVFIPGILTLGAAGNLLNLFLLVVRSSSAASAVRHRRRLEPLERAAFAGLVALAFSDLLFCVVGIPPAFLARWKSGSIGASTVAAYYYRMYREGFHNLFLFTSTWIIVVISAERFVAVYYPMRARWYLKVRNSVAVYSAIGVLGVLLSLPLFVKNQTEMKECSTGCTCLHVIPASVLLMTPAFKTAYHVIWSALGTFIPLIALCLTNAGLVLVLYKSRRRNLTNPERYGCSRVTVTVIAVVSSFLALVCPSMVLYSLELVFGVSRYYRRTYLIAMDVTNLTQAIKFASNFVLYCSTIRRFRRYSNQTTDGRRRTSRPQESLRSTYRSRPSIH